MAIGRAGRTETDATTKRLDAFASNNSGELDVFRHDTLDIFDLNGVQIGVSEQTYQVNYARFLGSHDGEALKMEMGLEVLKDFADETLERQLVDEKFRTLLVATDFSKSYVSGL